MRIEGTYTFPAPLDRVFAVLANPDTLARALPGCERLTQLGPPGERDEAALELRLRAGPGRAVYTTTARLAAMRHPAHLRLELDGRGPGGPVRAHGMLHLADEGDGTLGAYLWDIDAEGLPEEQRSALSNGAGQRLAQDFCARVVEALRAEPTPASPNGMPDGMPPAAVVHAVTARGRIVALPRPSRAPLAASVRLVVRRAAWMGAGLALGLGALALVVALAHRLGGQDEDDA